MGKRTYRAVEVKDVDVPAIVEKANGRLVISIDVAKKVQFAALIAGSRECLQIIHWSHPEDMPKFETLCTELGARGVRVEVAMEPSGTYGDALRAKLLEHKIAVFRVAGKRVKDAAEVFDGVPSMHDPKAAVVIGLLHLQGASEVWPLPSASERELEALRQVMAMYRDRREVQRGRLEALTARYWPELTYHLSLMRVAGLKLLATYGSPAAVAANAADARALMKLAGRSFLKDKVIDKVLKSARQSVGMAMLDAEVELVKVMAADALDVHAKAVAAAKQLVKKAAQDIVPTLSALIGMVTAASLVASGAAPQKYPTPSALVKAVGLNLREFSSGIRKGGLHISKRGDSLIRRLLYMAALRLIKKDLIVYTWFRAKVARDGGKKRKAIVAIMRKLTKALWHVGRGAEFDAAKLFNVRKLGPALEAAKTANQEAAMR